MKFLLIRLSSIGDIVLTTPVIRCLKTQVATAEVHYLTRHRFQPIVESNPYIDKIHYVQNDLSEVIRLLQAEDYDYVIDLHHNVRSLKIKKALGKKSYSFSKLNIEKWIYTTFKVNQLPRIHIVQRYLKTIEHFGIKDDGRGLDYFIADKDRVKEQDIPASHHAGYISIVIGAAHATKKLPVKKLVTLCSTIDHPIILLGGKEDYEHGERIAQQDPGKIYNACGKFNLNESADLVNRSKLVISHDTGLMHIAAAFRKPILSVWGNTVPAFGMTPYYGSAGNQEQSLSDVFEVQGLQCRPCSKIGYRKCPRGHFKCMRNQNLDAIVQRTYERLGRSQ
ncbi:MAG TPA: glycosyltransferase family 9 protein [Flavitalea sp.]|nr:glycosyltransferase family 9 protein [Flavitalea sp.]